MSPEQESWQRYLESHVERFDLLHEQLREQTLQNHAQVKEQIASLQEFLRDKMADLKALHAECRQNCALARSEIFGRLKAVELAESAATAHRETAKELDARMLHQEEIAAHKGAHFWIKIGGIVAGAGIVVAIVIEVIKHWIGSL